MPVNQPDQTNAEPEHAEHRTAEEALRESERRFQAVLAAGSDILYRMSPDWSELRFLEGRALLADASTPSRAWLEAYVPPEDQPRVREAIATAIRTKGLFELECRVRRADGSLAWVLSRAVPLLDAAGEIIEWFGTSRDITPRKEVEAALRDTQAASEWQRRLYETILSTTLDLVYVFDLNYRFIFVNDALLRMWGRTLEDSLGKSLLEVGYEPWQATMHEREIDQVVATRQPIRGEVAFPHATLGRRIYDYIFVPVFNADGKVGAVAGTTRDVTDRKEVEEALLAADRAKDNFLAMLSHELRNPLGVASNAVRLLQAHGKDVPALRRPLEMLARQTAHMTRLVDDLLDVSRVTQGKVRMEEQPVALDGVVADVAEDVRPLLQEKGLRFRFDGDRSVFVRGDAVRLEQVVANLVENAVKYTNEGEIHVSLRQRDGAAQLRVRDTGAGIAAEMLPHVFDLFLQASATLARSEGGLGIGLTVAKRLVEMHGGSIVAESPGLGQGSTFTVTLPAIEAPEAAGTHEASGAAVEPLPAEPRRILVVDDNADAAEALVEILRLWGHEAWAVHDGVAALREAHDHRPDVLLLDIGLPELDGYEVARRLRAEPDTAPMRIIALTGYGQDADRQRALDASCDGHLLKPVDMGALARIVAGD